MTRPKTALHCLKVGFAVLCRGRMSVITLLDMSVATFTRPLTKSRVPLPPNSPLSECGMRSGSCWSFEKVTSWPFVQPPPPPPPRPMGTAAYGGKGQGKGKGRGDGRLGQGGRGRSKGGEKPMGTTAYGGKGSKGRAANGDRPVGAASCRRDHHTMASCQPPPPPVPPVTC